MRSLVGCLVVAAMVVVTAGCGSSSTGSPGTSPVTSPGAPTAAPPAAPTAAPPAAPTAPVAGGSECASIPTFSTDPDQPSPAPKPDPDLERRLPTQIDGQPVTDTNSGYMLDSMCQFVGQAGIDEMRSQGVLPTIAAMTYGTTTATVGGEEIVIQAFRVPGIDANRLLAELAAFERAQGEDTGMFDSFQPGTAGGKNVSTIPDADGVTSFAYTSGDTLIVVDDVTQEQADKIFAAVP